MGFYHIFFKSMYLKHDNNKLCAADLTERLKTPEYSFTDGREEIWKEKEKNARPLLLFSSIKMHTCPHTVYVCITSLPQNCRPAHKNKSVRRWLSSYHTSGMEWSIKDFTMLLHILFIMCSKMTIGITVTVTTLPLELRMSNT